MSFIATLIALLLEQARPLSPGNLVHSGMRSWVRACARTFDAGTAQHAWLSVLFAVMVPSLVVMVIHWALWMSLGLVFAMLWSVAILYVTLGFRQFSHHFTKIRDALDSGDEIAARELLAKWAHLDASELPRKEVLRHVIEHSVISAHRHVYGVLAWFSILAALGLGPAGAVIYRMSEFSARYWRQGRDDHTALVSLALQSAVAKVWDVVDWLPARFTAMSFAVVGSFEDAIDEWRLCETRGLASNDAVIIAATSGAVNVRLGDDLRDRNPPVPTDGADDEANDASVMMRAQPELAHLNVIVGLVWRAVVLWMLLLALLTLARLLG